jgi:hypothetical protein
MEFLKLWFGRAALMLVVALLAAGLVYTFPADLAFLLAVDLATWAEAVVVVFAAAQITKVRPFLTYIRARLFVRRRQRPRALRQRPRGETANDDPGEPDRALAA